MIASVTEQLIQLLQEIPGVAEVRTMPSSLNALTLPAVILDIGEMAYGFDVGTERLPLVIHWEARLIVNQAMHEVTLWSLVEALLLALFQARWPSDDIGPVQIKQASPDSVSPDLDGCRVWLLEWTQSLHIGRHVWSGEGITPTQLTWRYEKQVDGSVSVKE